MSTLRIARTDRRWPGGAAVSAHSRFEPVARAQPLAARAAAVPSPARAIAHERVSLSGEWRRLPLDQDPADVGALPDPASATWQRVRVPDCFGLEPSLSTHFGPVFYQRRLPLVSGPARLEFEAVDYLCDVWLGARWLGRHEGYFAPFAFDVDAIDEGALLTVRVQDPFEDLDPQLPFVLHAKRVIKGTLKYHDSRPGGLPGHHTPGWTAREGQSLTTAGITGEVELTRSGAVRIDAVFITPIDVAAGRAHMAIVLSARAERDVTLVLQLSHPRDGRVDEVALDVHVPDGAGRVDVELEIDDSVAWWPASHADLGGPRSYQLRVVAQLGDVESDARCASFGLRTARVEGDPKRLSVNGRAVFVQACNYIPNQHFADATLDFYRRDFELCTRAHLNSVGVHGHVQCAECYRAADEAGMLVFQDFALQWHYDAGADTNPGFVELACRQIADMAYTLYNHPSVVYWACHNEPTAMFIPGMPRDPARDADNQVLDEALEAALRAVEPTRHVHRASGLGDDVHLYDGSLLGGVVYDVRKHQTWFVSEYGFWTIGEQAARYGDARWPPDAELMHEWLSRLSFAASTFAFSGLPERYPSLDAWCRATEAYGSLLCKYQTEWLRMHRGAPFFAYRWHFFADWWGWAGGGLVDVDRQPKATYRALAAASRQVLVATSLPDTVVAPGAALDFPIVAINETRAAVELRVEWTWRRAPASIVIGADEEVTTRYSTPAPKPRSVVVTPIDVLEGHVPSGDVLVRGELNGRVEPESTATLGNVLVTAPSEALSSAILELSWGNGERNWFAVLAAPPGWFPGAGAFIVENGAVRRLGT